MIGQTIQQYLIVDKLGNGAMGSVYLAKDTMQDRPAALKFILSDFNDHPDMAKRFLEEARVLASLNRPNIPVLYSYFIWEGKGVMAMEYVDGQTLESLIRQRGPIPANVCVPWVKQALQGLAAAHRIGVVHRDLKPGNLMLNREGTVKVVDFGIAKKIEVEAGLTATNTTVGTPWYMAPEQILGKPVTPRTDIYSMGVVLYELLAGQVPFHADSLFEIHTAHVQKIPEPPTIHYPHIPPAIVKAVMKALEKDPKDRFQTAEEFLHALPDGDAVGQEPVPVQPHSPRFPEAAAPTPVRPAQPRPPETASPFPSTAQQTASPILNSSDSATSGQLPPPSRRRRVPPKDAGPPPPSAVSSSAEDSKARQDQASKPSGKRSWPLIGGLAAALLLVAGGGAWFLSHGKSSSPENSIAVSQPTQPVTPSSSAGPLLTPDQPSEAPAPEPGPAAKESPKAAPDEEKPRTTAKPKPEEKPKNVPQPPPDQTSKVSQPVAGQELSGLWHGTYVDTTSQERTTVRLKLEEANGSSISGTLAFNGPNNTSGTCSLGGSAYIAGSGTLRLLIHCPDLKTAPGFLNTPNTLKIPDPTGRAFTGRALGYPTVAMDISR